MQVMKEVMDFMLQFIYAADDIVILVIALVVAMFGVYSMLRRIHTTFQ